MDAITIDDAAKYVSVLSFHAESEHLQQISHEVQRTVERRAPKKDGFIGCIVMRNAEAKRLLVMSAWENQDAWSKAQYDQEIGRAVADAVEKAKSYEIEIYETVTVVRG